MTEYEYEYNSASQISTNANTNMNIIQFPKMTDHEKVPNTIKNFRRHLLRSGDKKYKHKQYQCYISFMVFEMQLQYLFEKRKSSALQI